MIAVISDTHFGARSSSSIFREYMKGWYDVVFFPTLVQNGVKHILHGGDFFDSRNAIALQDIDLVVNWFAKKLVELDIKITVVLGNHDVAFRNTNKIHSLSVLKAAAPNHVDVVEDPKIETIDGQRYALIPWINSSNYDDTLKFMAEIKDKGDVIVLGHFEIQNFAMYKNSSLCDHGLDAALFKEFKEVWSGHFHHSSCVGNIRYLGSAFYMNWQDHNDPRGFYLFDGTLNFQLNEYTLFCEITFEKDILAAMTDDEYKDMFESKFVRLNVIDSDYDRVALLDTISKINRSKPHDLQIINHAILASGSTTEDQTAVEEKTSKTTEEYIESYISARDQFNTTLVKQLMSDCMAKAQQKMVVGE